MNQLDYIAKEYFKREKVRFGGTISTEIKLKVAPHRC